MYILYYYIILLCRHSSGDTTHVSRRTRACHHVKHVNFEYVCPLILMAKEKIHTYANLLDVNGYVCELSACFIVGSLVYKHKQERGQIKQ